MFPQQTRLQLMAAARLQRCDGAAVPAWGILRCAALFALALSASQALPGALGAAPGRGEVLLSPALLAQNFSPRHARVQKEAFLPVSEDKNATLSRYETSEMHSFSADDFSFPRPPIFASQPQDESQEEAWLPLHQATPTQPTSPQPATRAATPTVPSSDIPESDVITSWLEIKSPQRFTSEASIKTVLVPTDIYPKSEDMSLQNTMTLTPPIKDLFEYSTNFPTEPSSQYIKSWSVFSEKPLAFSSAEIIQSSDKDESSWLMVDAGEILPPVDKDYVEYEESVATERDIKSTLLSMPSTSAEQSSTDSAAPAADTQGKFGAHVFGGHAAFSALREATSFGLDQMRYLYNVTEPELYHMGLTLKPGSAGSLLAAFNWQPSDGAALTHYAHAALQTSSHLRLTPHLLRLPGGRPAAPDSVLLRQCPLRHDSQCPGEWQRFRTADGRCNNPRHASRGAAFTPFRRLMPADYHDGVQDVRRSVTGEQLPSARLLSSTLLRDSTRKDAFKDGERPEESHVSHLLMQWGQFVDHDLTATPQSFGFNGSVPQCCAVDQSGNLAPHLRHPECLPIRVPREDPHFGVLGVRCLQFMRSAPAPMPDCSLGSRQQANAVTAFLDGSGVYASSQQRQLELRLFHQGLLNSLPGTKGKPMLPPASPEEQSLCRFSALHPCLKAGDFRANEQPGLTSLHILWLREHNRIATKLRAMNTEWGDERVFQETRRIVVATLQHITYTEFLPQVLGSEVTRVFDLNTPHPGYDPDVDPTVPNAFAAAAYRFGHTLVQDSLWRCNALHQPLPNNVSLHEELAVAGSVLGGSATERLLIGLSRQLARNSDHRISRELIDHLFESPASGPGLDLAAINIQRGRDHGLPAYNRWRKPCGLRTLEKWEDLGHVAGSRFASVLPQLYNHVDDVDLYVGGLAERPVPGGLVGPTFACIIGQTFADLRLGDRFWYEVQGLPSSFTPSQLEQVQRSSLARLLCNNLEGARTVPRWPLRASPSIPSNEYIKCTDVKKIPQMNLSPWQESTDGSRPSTLGNEFTRASTLPSAARPKPPAVIPNSGGGRPRPTKRPNVGVAFQPRPRPRPRPTAKPTREGTTKKPKPRPAMAPNRVIAIATQLNQRPIMSNLAGAFPSRPRPSAMPNLGVAFQARPTMVPNQGPVFQLIPIPSSGKPNQGGVQSVLRPSVTPNRLIAIATQVNAKPAVMSNLMSAIKPPRFTVVKRPAAPVKVVQRQGVPSDKTEEDHATTWPTSEIPTPISRQQA